MLLAAQEDRREVAQAGQLDLEAAVRFLLEHSQDRVGRTDGVWTLHRDLCHLCLGDTLLFHVGVALE